MTIDDLIARMAVGDFIQVVAVLVAIGASIIALVLSWRDRVSARKIAAEDRRVALEQAKLMFDLEQLLRLLENGNRGGSTDALERSRLGAEALSLIGLLGPELLPRQWARRIEHEDKELREKLTDESESPEFIKDTIETQLAVNTTVDRIRKIIDRK